MKHHEFATLFPMLPDAELRTLADDIRENGLETAIVTLDGAILDGRNRHRACELAGVTPRFEEYTGNDPMQFVISHNLHRRHLTESQRGMVAANIAKLQDGQRPSIDGGLITEGAARQLLNVGESTVTRAKKIQRLGAPELVAAVESGEVTVGAAYKVAELPQDQQREILSEGADAVKETAKKMRLAGKPSNTANPSCDPSCQHSANPSSKIPAYAPSDALAIWATAKSVLNRIHAKDTERRAALEAAKQYIQTRLENDQ